ncbi:SDR family NAD(P)-dependent oxidoreductase [Agrobacterium tumefaciens]|uniref:SDR family NAD(P)-dependent oxidoreductase n=1 Tax=Agrobacterium tumefaciens TaxID=358 RepID=UPI002209035C|nr:glucose 1-dehydrogenase [Agrobacterium tumefaciens]UXT00361.1 glucose 1-dehydrogenase [Agrobacterium tumefaciens]
MNRVKDKVAIVTGAASGMGRAHVLALAREGAHVVVTDLNETGGAETVRLAQESGAEAQFVPHDISKEGDWERVIAAAIDRFGRINVLVNNAGVYTVGSAEESTVEQWDFVFNVNARGTFIGVHLVIPHMKQAGGGSIINVSSNFALVGRPGFSIYCASKGAVRLFSKAVAAEVAGDNIRVNSLHPGLIRTPMTASLIETQEGLDMLLGGALLRRAAEPEEIANAVLYLASDESSFMTGSEMVIDGGYVAV